MKITAAQLRRIIKEEVEGAMAGETGGSDTTSSLLGGLPINSGWVRIAKGPNGTATAADMADGLSVEDKQVLANSILHALLSM